LLGTIDLRTGDGRDYSQLLVKPVPIALLIYLVVARPRGFHRRDSLVSLFWPETDQERARSNLRKVVHTLRHSLGDGVVVSRGDEELGVAPDRLWCDAVEFEEACGRNWLLLALELYQGEFARGFFVPVSGSAGFQDFLARTRFDLSERAAQAAIGLARAYEGESNVTDAVRFAKQAAVLAPSDERTLRRVLEMLDRVGDRAAALRLYQEFERRLKAEYGAVPSPETRALIERIRSG
jgi:serine/threonine-protein kinase